ncbi:hypothetical protein BDZ45DRAFT_47409 [Acephala macrosclerotiorum]|nr:hypothetical protein BDZ45DRAFT_47409 [Acephala macrosclerotiorum]
MVCRNGQGATYRPIQKGNGTIKVQEHHPSDDFRGRKFPKAPFNLLVALIVTFHCRFNSLGLFCKLPELKEHSTSPKPRTPTSIGPPKASSVLFSLGGMKPPPPASALSSEILFHHRKHSNSRPSLRSSLAKPMKHEIRVWPSSRVQLPASSMRSTLRLDANSSTPSPTSSERKSSRQFSTK